MFQGIPEAIIDEIRQRTDLVSLVEEYLTLEKRGKNMVGLCPFHSEKTPSFSVSPEKQLFHCFGCGASGNVFGFVMKMDNLSFTEAARMLARRAGVKIPEPKAANRKQDLLREQIYALNRLALHFFCACLKDPARGKEAAQYLQDRGIDQGSIELFKLGYAQAGGIALPVLPAVRLFAGAAAPGGLVLPGERRRRYDRFRHRVIFPIFI